MPLKLNKALFNTFCIFMFLLTLSSCSDKTRNVLFKSPQETADTVQTTYVVQAGTKSENSLQIIKPGDQLLIQNLQNPSLISGVSEGGGALLNTSYSTGYRVETDGYVALPVIGRTKLAGMKRIEAERFLENKYKENLLNNPIITIDITNARVTVLGEIEKQGNYILTKEGTSLIDIIGESGGLNQRANKRKIKIIRGDRTNPEVIIVNLENINTLADKKLILQNNDIIYAEARGIFRASDNLNFANPFIQTGLVILNTALLIYTITRN